MSLTNIGLVLFFGGYALNHFFGLGLSLVLAIAAVVVVVGIITGR